MHISKKTHKRCLKYLVSMIIKVIHFNKEEIGMLLIALAALFQTLGVLLFFKRSLILISNVTFNLLNLDSILRRIVFLCWNFRNYKLFYKKRYCCLIYRKNKRKYYLLLWIHFDCNRIGLFGNNSVNSWIFNYFPSIFTRFL